MYLKGVACFSHFLRRGFVHFLVDFMVFWPLKPALRAFRGEARGDARGDHRRSEQRRSEQRGEE